MYTDFLVQWARVNFEKAAERQDCATQFLIEQMKKVRQDLKEEAKKAADAQAAATAATAGAVAKHAKHRTVAATSATPTAPGAKRRTVAPTPATTTTLATHRVRRSPRNPVAPPTPATPRSRRTPRSPLGNRPAPVSSSSLPSSSPLANRGALTTRKRARFVDDDNGEVSRSLLRPPTKRQRQVELPELRFNSFSVSFCGPDTNQIHSMTYASVNEFPRLVLWARERAPQLRTVPMLLKTTITLRNDKYLDIFLSVEQGGRVELGIPDQGSWNSALMMAQGNPPNADSFFGLLVVAIAAESDQNHGVSEEIMPDYTGKDEDRAGARKGQSPWELEARR